MSIKHLGTVADHFDVVLYRLENGHIRVVGNEKGYTAVQRCLNIDKGFIPNDGGKWTHVTVEPLERKTLDDVIALGKYIETSFGARVGVADDTTGRVVNTPEAA
jgi:hypothetical protein